MKVWCTKFRLKVQQLCVHEFFQKSALPTFLQFVKFRAAHQPVLFIQIRNLPKLGVIQNRKKLQN